MRAKGQKEVLRKICSGVRQGQDRACSSWPARNVRQVPARLCGVTVPHKARHLARACSTPGCIFPRLTACLCYHRTSHIPLLGPLGLMSRLSFALADCGEVGEPSWHYQIRRPPLVTGVPHRQP